MARTPTEEAAREELKESDRRWWENLDRYCVRCDSCLGYDPKRADFCLVCWYTRKPLPRRVRERLALVA